MATLLDSPVSVSHGQLFIDGTWIEAADGGTFETKNPATGETLATVAAGDAADIDRAVRAARRAYEGVWGRMSARDRGRRLFKLAQLLERDLERLAALETADNGKPIRDARLIDLPQVIETFEYFAGLATKIEGETIPLPGDVFNYTVREPFGVCGQIIPWNFPLLMCAWKLAPALAAGNTCVLKPAEQTPLTALALGRLIQEADFPDGVVNIVPGFGETAGAALARHPDVDKLAFTGSTEVGRRIAHAAAAHLTPVSLELGGKAPNIILPDADLDQAVEGALMGIFFNQGQVCCAGSRLFVAEPLREPFLERLVRRTRELRIGDPMAADTQLGPQVSLEQRDRIHRYVDIGCAEGAAVLTGGRPARMPGRLAGGYFFEPTILTNVGNRMRVAQEEIFGPVTAVLSFADEDDLVRQANETIYGLSAGVWTRDIGRAHRLAKALKAGVVWINTYNMIHPASPFGGFKESGYGRELGRHAVDLYTQTKSVWVDLSDKPIGWFA